MESTANLGVAVLVLRGHQFDIMIPQTCNVALILTRKEHCQGFIVGCKLGETTDKAQDGVVKSVKTMQARRVEVKKNGHV